MCHFLKFLVVKYSKINARLNHLFQGQITYICQKPKLYCQQLCQKILPSLLLPGTESERKHELCISMKKRNINIRNLLGFVSVPIMPLSQ